VAAPGISRSRISCGNRLQAVDKVRRALCVVVAVRGDACHVDVGQHLELERGARPRPCAEGLEERDTHRHHRPEAYPASAATSTVATRTDFLVGTTRSSGDHGSKYRVEVSARGVRTGSQNHHPAFRSARLILWHRSFPPSTSLGRRDPPMDVIISTVTATSAQCCVRRPAQRIERADRSQIDYLVGTPSAAAGGRRRRSREGAYIPSRLKRVGRRRLRNGTRRSKKRKVSPAQNPMR
jgi:hypothetical protein